MKKFENDLIDMIETIKFKKVNDQFLDKLSEEVKKVNTSNNVFVFADKTKNIYETTPENYNKILRESITKTYKLSDENIMDTINEELYKISKDLSIEDRIETMRKQEAFITIKDHKENFEVNPTYRLINPAKGELGKVSKIILDNINDTIRTKLKINQWKNTQSVIKWFNNISNKTQYSFLTFDITEFYPSITEDLLDKAISWAQTMITIPKQHITTIKHARKSFLFNNGNPWIKRNNDSLFDVTMGSVSTEPRYAN
jgi:hypothetical protein